MYNLLGKHRDLRNLMRLNLTMASLLSVQHIDDLTVLQLTDCTVVLGHVVKSGKHENTRQYIAKQSPSVIVECFD